MLSSKCIRQSIENSACEYTDMVVSRIKRGDFRLSDADDILFYLSEVSGLEFLNDYQKEIASSIKSIISIIREAIYEGNPQFIKYQGMFKGIGILAVSFNTLERKGINLNNFKRFSQSVIRDYFQYNLTNFYSFTTHPHYYDSIYGAAGALNYIIENCIEDQNLIDLLLRYLISLSFTDESGYILYSIKEKPLYEDRSIVPYLDFGMAHGVLAPLIVMVKAKMCNLSVHGQSDAIANLLNLYSKYAEVDHHGVMSFPTQLQLHSIDNSNNYSFNCSWCYGNACILFVLSQIANMLNDFEQHRRYSSSLEQLLLNKDIYNLSEPIVCHGLSSMVQIQTMKRLVEGDFTNETFSTSFCEDLYATLEKHYEFSPTDSYLGNYSFLEGSGGVILTLIQSLGYLLAGSSLLMLR